MIRRYTSTVEEEVHEGSVITQELVVGEDEFTKQLVTASKDDFYVTVIRLGARQRGNPTEEIRVTGTIQDLRRWYKYIYCVVQHADVHLSFDHIFGIHKSLNDV